MTIKKMVHGVAGVFWEVRKLTAQFARNLCFMEFRVGYFYLGAEFLDIGGR